MLNVNVNIFQSAVNALKEISIRQSPNETGGVLAGTRHFQDNVLEFNILGVLGATDCGDFKDAYIVSPTEFICTDRVGWANLALKAVQTFGMSYVGDWHSHPKCNLSKLSFQDISILMQQHILGQFEPYPPLHILTHWSASASLINISANIMLGEYIAVVKPEIICN